MAYSKLTRVTAPPFISYCIRRTMSDIITCAICMAPLNDDIETANPTSLECDHAFHTYCITTYCRTANQTINEIPCPTCKQTGIEISELRSQAQRDMLIPGEPLETQQPPRTPPPPGTEVDALSPMSDHPLTPPNAQPSAAQQSPQTPPAPHSPGTGVMESDLDSFARRSALER